MKTSPILSKHAGLTLIELLVVVAVIVILAAMLLPAGGGPRKAKMPMCMSNQKQIAILLLIFQDDHNGKYPWQVSSTNNGSMEFVSSNQVNIHFRALSEYIAKQTRIFVCPTDTTRRSATNLLTMTNTNISYFLNLDTATNQNSIGTGDRYLKFNDRLISPGMFVQTTNTGLKWSDGFHMVQKKPSGIFSFGDGHVEIVRETQLDSFLHRQPTGTNRLCFP